MMDADIAMSRRAGRTASLDEQMIQDNTVDMGMIIKARSIAVKHLLLHCRACLDLVD
jgi:hypothetical protein